MGRKVMPSDKVITSFAATVSFALTFVILLIGGPILLLLIPLFICAAIWMFVILVAIGMAQARFNFDHQCTLWVRCSALHLQQFFIFF
jgi:hypothetical protein